MFFRVMVIMMVMVIMVMVMLVIRGISQIRFFF